MNDDVVYVVMSERYLSGRDVKAHCFFDDKKIAGYYCAAKNKCTTMRRYWIRSVKKGG